MKKYIVLITATVLLLFAGFYLYQHLNKIPNSMLFQQNFSPYLPVTDLKGSLPISPNRNMSPIIPPADASPASIAKLMLEKGVRAYNSDDYPEAIHQFNSYLLSGQVDKAVQGEVKFYLGVAYLAANQTQNAKKVFNELIDNSRQHSFEDEAQWYLSLTYLKEEDVKSAKKLLAKIAKNGHPFEDKAKSLLSKI